MLASFWRSLQARIGRTRFAAYLLSVSAVVVALAYRLGPMGDEYFLFWGIYFAGVSTLVVRRLHDMNFSGWWSLALPVLFFSRIAVQLTCGWGGCDPILDNLFELIPWVGGALVVALLIIPGSKGTNRFSE